mgnify:CR=1 FL=1
MKQMIKFEVKRMLRNPGFYIAMMIGLLISVVHWIVWVLPAARGMDKYMFFSILHSYIHRICIIAGYVKGIICIHIFIYLFFRFW